MSGRVDFDSVENRIRMEIDAKECLIRNQRAYGITDFEVTVLTEALESYKMQLEEMNEGIG